MTTSLLWFRRDLRLHDNAALLAARQSSSTVYAVYCAEELGTLNERQRAFVLGALRSMRLALAKVDATLTMADGPSATALVKAATRLGASTVFAARSYERAERQGESGAEAALAGASMKLSVHRGHVIHEPETIAEKKQATGAGYRVFPPYYETWRALVVPATLPVSAPNGRDPQPGFLAEPAAVVVPEAGEAAALAAMQRFITARAADYALAGAYPAADGTSKLSAHLRFGCISPRTLYHAVAERMARSWTLAQERMSMLAFLRRLAMRDFYVHLAYYAPDLHDEALQDKMRGFQWSNDPGALEAWTGGRTGYPFVDAAMRQLRDQGEVHQRAAICAASFCCFDLGLDWRFGRDVWMRELVAADAALCDGNWQRIAGVGSDQASYPRIYNPMKQARYFDAQAVYVRRWCKELAKLPTRAVLAPWDLDRNQQVELGFFTPGVYPPRIVDHEKAAREMLARYQAYRNR